MHLCDFCNHEFSTKSYLNYHIKNAKYCLELQGTYNNDTYKCTYCSKILASQKRLSSHLDICTEYAIKKEYNKRIDMENMLKQKISELEEQLLFQQKRHEKQIRELQDKLENIAIRAVSNDFDFENEAIIEIEQEDDIESEIDDYELLPLSLGEGYVIEHREEDNYINVTNLCKAGGKKFNDWNRLQRTKAFLLALSTATGIPAADLINTGTGSTYEGSGTWVHPQVAINIAQWVSPQFDVKVSAWIYEVMMTGKVDITNTKSYRQLQLENKDHKLKIQLMTKKYVKKQPRVEIKETNVIYILTTKLMKKERRYILGKATNLTNRLSTYNKSDEHEIVYYQGCGDEDNMSIVEPMVFSKLKSYREQANRERFILPEGRDVSVFIDAIKECVSFIK